MNLVRRSYCKETDFDHVSQFLIEQHQPGNTDGNWLQPAWEYMHCHPSLDEGALDKIRIWEANGEIVAVIHYESNLGEAFFELHPNFAHLKAEMLDYAESNLYGENPAGVKTLQVYVNDFDQELETLVKTRGYEVKAERSRPLYFSLFLIHYHR